MFHILTGRKPPMGRLEGEACLYQVSLVGSAFVAASRLTGGLHGGNQQAGKDSDDPDHDKELNERKTLASTRSQLRGRSPAIMRMSPNE